MTLTSGPDSQAEEGAAVDWSAERIRRYRDLRLRSLLAYAHERSAFYADRPRGLDFETVLAADLASIPMLTKAEAQLVRSSAR